MSSGAGAIDRTSICWLYSKKRHTGYLGGCSEGQGHRRKGTAEVQALTIAIAALQAGILVRTELVQEEDAANEVVDLRQKLDCAVQETLRKHGINVQRYWNGAVCVCVFSKKISYL